MSDCEMKVAYQRSDNKEGVVIFRIATAEANRYFYSYFFK